MSYKVNENGVKEYTPALYIQKYYDELFTNLLEEAYDNSLISHNELFVNYVKSRQDISSYYVMTLSIIADTEEDIYYDMTDVYYSDKVDYALGSDLDDIGARIGCPRPQATKSGVELVFSVSIGSDSTIVIPEGVIVSTHTGTSYITTEPAEIPSGEKEVSVYAKSVESGWGTRVGANTLNSIVSTNSLESSGLSVTNPQSSTGGSNAYSDDEYRALLKQWVQNNTRGSKEAYTRYFASVDGLDSYKLIPNWNGSGTLKIVLDPGYPYQLRECYEQICERVCQLPDDITMFSPERVPINIYAKCNVDIDEINPYSANEKEVIKSKIIDAIRSYIDGDPNAEDKKEYTGLTIGEDFIPYKLGIYISKKVPELKNIVFENPTEPVTVLDEEMAVSNDINVEME